jgi:hypothetical protein
MTNKPATIIATLKQIHELSENAGATEAERQAASDTLNRLLAKHKLTMAEIENDVTTRAEFKFKSEFELRLIEQIVTLVAGADTKAIDRKSGNPNIPADTIYFTVTKAQEADISTLYSVYRKALSKELDSVFVAFVYTNSIFPDNPGTDNKDLSQEESGSLLKSLIYASAMEPVTVHKQPGSRD